VCRATLYVAILGTATDNSMVYLYLLFYAADADKIRRKNV